MLHPIQSHQLTRRELLRAGGLGAVGLSLLQLLAARGLSAEGVIGDGTVAKADACIVLFLNGGPSHLDMWDIVATIYRLLGVDHRHELYDSLDRPHAVVPKARVVKELIA